MGGVSEGKWSLGKVPVKLRQVWVNRCKESRNNTVWPSAPTFSNSSGVYICKSIVNYLRRGNYICKSKGINLHPPVQLSSSGHSTVTFSLVT